MTNEVHCVSREKANQKEINLKYLRQFMVLINGQYSEDTGKKSNKSIHESTNVLCTSFFFNK